MQAINNAPDANPVHPAPTPSPPRASLPLVLLIEEEQPAIPHRSQADKILHENGSANEQKEARNNADHEEETPLISSNAAPLPDEEGTKGLLHRSETSLSAQLPASLPTKEETEKKEHPQEEEEMPLNGVAAGEAESGARHGDTGPKLHHLTRHWLSEEARGVSAVERLGAPTIKAAEHMIRGMSQRELRAAFQKVYGSPTNSFNNNWLRRKLFEAVGVTGGAAKRTRRTGRDGAARAHEREVRQKASEAAEAEALEALAEIAAGPRAPGASATTSANSEGPTTAGQPPSAAI